MFERREPGLRSDHADDHGRLANRSLRLMVYRSKTEVYVGTAMILQGAMQLLAVLPMVQ